MLIEKATDPLVSVLAADHALDAKPPYEWEQVLREDPSCDGFAAILHPDVHDILFNPALGPSFSRWILGIDAWLHELWNPCHTATKEEVLLSILWDSFERRLTDALRRARVLSGIPTSGGVLAFVANLDKCIVLQYKFSGLIPKVTPVAVIPKPLSVFDLWGEIEHIDANAKNRLKTMLASGHKLVYHRDVLTHVDRRLDVDVFGPSIDTLVMAEILAQDIYMQTKKIIGDVLEIGSGSGMLSASVVRNARGLRELLAIDIDARAIACSGRNIDLAAHSPGVAPFELHLIVGKYTASVFSQKFDLVVCNPPYIPYIEKSINPLVRSADISFINAVAGLQLMNEVLRRIPLLLAPDGRLLLMLSSLSLKEFTHVTSNNYKITYPLGESGYRVPFDVEAVLSSVEWTSYLEKEHGLLKVGELYFHYLVPVWLEQK